MEVGLTVFEIPGAESSPSAETSLPKPNTETGDQLMNDAPLARESETPQKDNDAAPRFTRTRRMEHACRLTFLKMSAHYLGHTLTVRQLRHLAGRMEQ
jgi:hypothetical protein